MVIGSCEEWSKRLSFCLFLTKLDRGGAFSTLGDGVFVAKDFAFMKALKAHIAVLNDGIKL
ncbi:hypothetical protein C9J03_16515 [Photobacterium gaetbulicola]|uniref:Uncharacterized protein n=1 Tax=Photobacterium gaetbulicola Gung47 TaxID=658445 RepID=A0A0C5WQR0_9GAMM|nr:hypothetical protein H744_1c0234 [Photobacterium gaetbulicola Gung47]PSU06091.1 hypothetical protein C9J03_16515 [Photobacterium gaetbulicola]